MTTLVSHQATFYNKIAPIFTTILNINQRLKKLFAHTSTRKVTSEFE